MATVSAQPAFAIKEFGEHFGKYYVEDSKNDDFKKLVADAKCNVCHIDGADKKKVRNPYGEELKAAGLEKKKFQPMIKGDPDKARKEIEVLFKKIEEIKAEGKEKSFGQLIKDGQLPGGDIKGK